MSLKSEAKFTWQPRMEARGTEEMFWMRSVKMDWTQRLFMPRGPMPMLRALKEYAEKNHIECWISMEERMACGIGACLACVCQSKEKDAHSNVKNKRICKEGPVFRAEEVEF